MIYDLYNVEINMNEQILITGYNIKNEKYLIMNIMLNLAQYVIYKLYVKKGFENMRVTMRMLFNEFKSFLKLYFHCKIYQKYLGKEDINKILTIL